MSIAILEFDTQCELARTVSGVLCGLRSAEHLVNTNRDAIAWDNASELTVIRNIRSSEACDQQLSHIFKAPDYGKDFRFLQNAVGFFGSQQDDLNEFMVRYDSPL